MKFRILFLSLLFLSQAALAKTQSSAQNTAQTINLANGFADVVQELIPTTVSISTSGEISNGSGFIVSSDGYIVTNNHVIENSGEITVILNDGARYKPKIIGIDKKSDIAVLKINAGKILPAVKIGDSSKMRIGNWIIIVGNPYGFGGSVSVGVLSAVDRSINNGQGRDFFQTDAAINKGSSGGPVFNAKGEFIAISTALFSPSGGSVGISFAYPSSLAWPIIKQLKEQGEVTRGWIGISVQNITEEMAASLGISRTKGALINDVTKDGPADKAGIVASDVIIKIGDQEVNDMKTLPLIISQAPIGKTMPITVLRRGKVKIFSVKIAKAVGEDS